ncbi:DUF1697 domain-containing protein [Segetibacter sp.]|jgi:uncharacterized protein (DUF1697 family)|uniref:DUF1697 domain-containing protein n=1 Tax=Segetibacter sp. TaxID=2231182 RepID=UPI0026194D56|nr:DUF1697 domain-containing protein [Segetibacter sp.]MCW3081874.1 hypothetical protein [Segetibacter sp.]
METFITILRGINVGGHHKIEMAGLKAMFEKLGFETVTTYIQSGNVIFNAAPKASSVDLSNTIRRAIVETYGFEVPVIIRTLTELEKAITANPFLNEADVDEEKLHLTFLADVADKDKIDKISHLNFAPDRFIIIEKEIYLYCPLGYGITKLSNNFFENKLKLTATTRNWRTVNKLLDLANTN